MSVSLDLDPATRDMVLDDDGQPVYTSRPRPELVLAIGVPVGSFHGDPAQGSRIPKLVSGGRVTANPGAELEAAARDALSRLEQSGLIIVQGVSFDQGVLEIDSEDLAEPLELKL